MAKSRKGACGKPMKKSRKGACGKTMKKSRKGGKAKKGACSKDIKFASSMKAKCFIKTKMAGKSVKAVGGIQHALGKKFKKAGFGTAEKLSCEAKTMTKRNFMRYMLETAGGNVRHAMDAYVSMKDHCRKVKDCKCGGKSSASRGRC